MRRAMISLLASVAILGPGAVSTPVRAQVDSDAAYQDEYQTGDFGRVLYEENGLTLLRAPSQDYAGTAEEATVNSPVFPGDTLLTDADQRAEVQLAGGTLVRLDRATELVLQALPDPYADYSDSALLKLSRGAIQLASRLRDKEEFRIDTPESSVYLLGDGDFRIEVDAGATRVLSRRGVAEVVSEGGSVLLRGGMRTSVYAGTVPEDPRPFNTFASDSFDRWIADRDDALRPRERYAYEDDVEAYEELPYEIRPYYSELSRHGRWVFVPSYGYCWYPYDVGPGWRPYQDGYWAYGPRGYFWVSYEPWGWAPYHYGRWTWASGYGWCWIPGRVFSGAWVSWSWGSAYVGWAPLGYWNRPVWITTVHYGYYDPHCWTFVHYRHFHRRGYRGHAVDVRRIGGHLRGAAVVTRPPRISPKDLADDVSARERAVRVVREARDVRMPVIDKDRPPKRPFTDVEDRVVRRGRGRPARDSVVPRRTSGEQRPAAATDRRAPRARPTTRPEVRRIPGTTGGETPRAGAARPARPRSAVQKPSTETRRPTGRPSAAARDRREGSASQGRERAPTPRAQGRSGTARGRDEPAQVKPRPSGPGGTDARLRDLYRRMGEQRQPRAQEGRSSGRTRSAAPAPRRSPQRSPRAAPRSGSGPPRPKPSATPRSGSGPSRPKPSATPRKVSKPSKPSGASGSKSSSRSGSSARPKKTERSGKKR